MDADLVIVEPKTGARLQLRDSLGGDWHPSWRQDGESVVYSTWNTGIRFARERDITGQSESRLLAASSVMARISRDNRYLVTSFNSIDYSDGQGGQPTTFFPSASFDFDLSGDARYLAYSRVDNPGIVLRRFPSGSGQTTVTSLDASGIRFSRDDSEIFFWVDDVFMAASLDLSGPSLWSARRGRSSKPPPRACSRALTSILPGRPLPDGPAARNLPRPCRHAAGTDHRCPELGRGVHEVPCRGTGGTMNPGRDRRRRGSVTPHRVPRRDSAGGMPLRTRREGLRGTGWPASIHLVDIRRDARTHYGTLRSAIAARRRAKLPNLRRKVVDPCK